MCILASQVADDSNLSMAEAKEVLCVASNGGKVHATLGEKSERFVRQLSIESRFLRWLACSLLPDPHNCFVAEGKTWPENTVLHYLWATVEDQCLLAMQRYIMTLGPDHLSLQFDGFLMSAIAKAEDPTMCADLCAVVLDQTNFKVNVRKKVWKVIDIDSCAIHILETLV